jgi:hypothetical protein
MERTLFNGLLEQTCYQGRVTPKGHGNAKSKLDIEPHENSKKIRSNPYTEHCGDCDQVVTGRVVEYVKKFDSKDNFKHWQKKCLICREKIVVKNVFTK